MARVPALESEPRPPARRCYAFGPFVADCRKRLLWKDGAIVALTPKAFEILAVLIEGRGGVIDKDDLLRRVMQLEIEREALRKESDEVSKERLGKIEAELANLREQSNALTAQWQAEKDAVGTLRTLRQQLEEQATTRCSHRETHRDLASPRGSARQLQARNVDASNEQEQRDRACEHHHRFADERIDAKRSSA